MSSADMYLTSVAQVDEELRAFIMLMLDEGVRSYLEIGSKFGGSLWRAATALPVGSKIVSVDLPHGSGESLPHLRECIEELRRRGYEAELVVGDSTDPKVVKRVAALGPFDCVFVDANHTLPYVKQDWDNYRRMAPMIAFHDIARSRVGGVKPPVQVRDLWQEIKQGQRVIEFIAHGKSIGIGVIWPE